MFRAAAVDLLAKLVASWYGAMILGSLLGSKGVKLRGD